jgi:5'-nucleotidase / UDP-sugar diphosphatase
MKLKNKILLLLIAMSLSLLAAENLKLDIVFSNDVHGGIDRTAATFMNPQFPPMLGGGGVAATLIKHVRSLGDGRNRDNLLLDAGDFFQGHPIGTVTLGKAIIEYMNDVRYDAMTPGNHDYDSGEEALEEALALANFPVISANIIDRTTGDFPHYLSPYIILDKMGVKIAIIGFTTSDTKK